MSFDAITACRAVRVSPAQKSVLMALADRADQNGECYPSIPSIMEWTCLGRTAIIEAISALEYAGLITVSRKHGSGNRFVLNLEVASNQNNQSASRTSPPAGLVRETDYHPSACRTTTSPPAGPVSNNEATLKQQREPAAVATGATVPMADATKPKRKRADKGIALPDWIAAEKSAGRLLIAENDPVFEYSEAAGIPDDFMALAWVEFCRRYSEPNGSRTLKTYTDWRAVFRNAVRGNWLKLWFADSQGDYKLTTAGIQAQRLREERRRAKQTEKVAA